MKWAQQPDPELPRGHVLVEVAATAVNRADLLQRQGFYPPPPGASDILGLECSGVITELGEDVTGWSVGDEVCALLAGGGYAEKVAVPATQLLPVPAGVDLRVAASLPEVACTVWSNVVMRGGLRRGQVLLVHGGGGGIGTHAIQVGKALGARVAVTAGSEDKLNRCRELGADILINYRDSDFVASLAEATDNHGADVVLGQHGSVVPRAQRRRTRHGRPRRDHRNAGWPQGRSRHRQADGKARKHHVDGPAWGVRSPAPAVKRTSSPTSARSCGR